MDEKTDLVIKLDGGGTDLSEIGLSEEADVVENEPIEVPEARSIGALLLIEQYTSLRSEIEKRIEIRQQILALTLLVAGTFSTVGVQPGVPEVVLLFYPLIAMFPPISATASINSSAWPDCFCHPWYVFHDPGNGHYRCRGSLHLRVFSAGLCRTYSRTEAGRDRHRGSDIVPC